MKTLCTIRHIDNRFTEGRKGFYTVEAAIFLPLVILAVLSIAFFIKTDSVWENCMNGALDECSYSAASFSSGPAGIAAASRVRNRLDKELPMLQNLSVRGGIAGEHNICRVNAFLYLSLPLGFDRNFNIEGKIRYRDFIGRKYNRSSLGTEGLETPESSSAVWIFPKSGTCYHKENCTYVKAAVHSCILTSTLKRKYSACAMCNSGEVPSGSVVFCFSGDDTSYHRGNCRCINRHTIVIDRSEAEKKGYRPCSKCGGN